MNRRRGVPHGLLAGCSILTPTSNQQVEAAGREPANAVVAPEPLADALDHRCDQSLALVALRLAPAHRDEEWLEVTQRLAQAGATLPEPRQRPRDRLLLSWRAVAVDHDGDGVVLDQAETAIDLAELEALSQLLDRLAVRIHTCE